jgi:hypothetical protein
MKNRPVAVSLIGWLYILTGVIGFVYHFTELTARNPIIHEALAIEAIRLAAIACGVFVLRGHNWARWLALAWMGFHVVLSAFHAVSDLVVHCLFFVLIACFLFRRDASRYFREDNNHQQQLWKSRRDDDSHAAD